MGGRRVVFGWGKHGGGQTLTGTVFCPPSQQSKQGRVKPPGHNFNHFSMLSALVLFFVFGKLCNPCAHTMVQLIQ